MVMAVYTKQGGVFIGERPANIVMDAHIIYPCSFRMNFETLCERL